MMFQATQADLLIDYCTRNGSMEIDMDGYFLSTLDI